MPVPKRKRSRARKSKRNANKGIQVKPFSSCSNCKEPIASHQVCKGCGFYKGAKVLRTKSDRTITRTEVKAAQQAKSAKNAPTDVEPEPVKE